MYSPSWRVVISICLHSRVACCSVHGTKDDIRWWIRSLLPGSNQWIAINRQAIHWFKYSSLYYYQASLFKLTWRSSAVVYGVVRFFSYEVLYYRFVCVQSGRRRWRHYDVLQVNFLSHFYLTNLIIQRQTAARKSTFIEGEGQRPRSLRVINVSSSSYSRGSMTHLLEMTSRSPRRQRGHATDDESGRGWDIYGAYACSKLAMMLFTTELNFRHTVDNVICLAAHPGRRGLAVNHFSLRHTWWRH